MEDQKEDSVTLDSQDTDGIQNAAKSKKNKKNRKKEQKTENSKPDLSITNGSGDDTSAQSEITIDDDKNQTCSTKNHLCLDEICKAMQLMNINKPPRTVEEATSRSFKFWSTQPVPKMDEVVTSNENIEPNLPKEMIRQDPYSLPDGFVWDTLDIENESVLKELYTLLSENYVEDDDCLFRFDYQANFLKWALKPPGWKQEWHCGVRASKNKKLLGFISAIPASMCVHSKELRLVEINFLCVHKKLRSKRVAPVLIREITRRVNVHGIFQAVYTAGVVLPKPIASCRYWHRSLNPKKLIETRFSHLTRNMTLQRTIKLFKLPPTTKCPKLRVLRKEDIPSARTLLCDYLRRFKLHPLFTEDEFEHWFFPRDGIIDTYVVENDGKITDIISFYSLPSTVVNHQVHKCIKAAYSFYNVATSMSLKELMNDALILAKSNEFDVFNALDLMENKDFLEPLKFGVGDGNLQYYLYNWRCPAVNPNDIGLVLQ